MIFFCISIAQHHHLIITQFSTPKSTQVLEKLSKHCDGEYSAALHEQSARVIEQNRLCSIMKRRAHVKRDGVQIEYVNS